MRLLDKLFKRKRTPVGMRKTIFVPRNLLEIFNLVDSAINTNDLYAFICSINNCSKVNNLPYSIKGMNAYNEYNLKLLVGSFSVQISIGNTVIISYDYNNTFDDTGMFTSTVLESSLIEEDIELVKDLFIKVEDYFGHGLDMELWDALDRWENS